MREVVVITGANSLLAKKVSMILEDKFEIKFLTTSKNLIDNTKYFYWNTSKNQIDKNCLNNCSHIVHLAGYSILKRWSKKNQQIMYDSRINGSNLIHTACKENNHFPKTFISASAVGIYSSNKNKVTENSPKNKEWLGNLAQKWENSADKFKKHGSRIIKLRISLIFSKKAGFLKYNLLSMKLGFGAILGNQNRKINWMHIDDIANFIKTSIDNTTYHGPYNLSTDKYRTQLKLIRLIKRKLYPYCLIIKIPKFIPKLVLGKRYEVIDQDFEISNSKLKKTGFKIKYNDIDQVII